GQGSKTVLSQMAAEAMGVSLDRFFAETVDTSFDPAGGTSTSSRITMQAGRAAVAAGESARGEILRLAWEYLEADPQDLDLMEDEVFSRGHPDASVGLDALAKKFVTDKQRLIGSGTWEPRPVVIDPETGQGEPWAVYAFGVQAAEVEVNPETGEVRLLRIVAAHDVGRAIHPQGVEMQIDGGVYMGASFGLMEELVLKDGVVENPDLAAYLLPSSLDVPDEIEPILVESPYSGGPYGAKGAGEPPVVPTAAAIAAAIWDAVGVRVYDLPITAEKIVRELNGFA
ncbi:MAG: molybdopterin cofactor-binding domain-containing protein, partial [bacterium]